MKEREECPGSLLRVRFPGDRYRKFNIEQCPFCAKILDVEGTLDDGVLPRHEGKAFADDGEVWR